MNPSVTKKCFKSQRPEVIKGFDCSNDVYAAVHGAIGEDRKLAKKNAHVILLTHGSA